MSMPQDRKVEFAYDVGHSSIGWSALTAEGGEGADPSILACGSVLFPPDDCLASHRRAFRRMRRNIRSTRQRIRRIRDLLAALQVLTPAELDERTPSSAPWFLAARVLAGGGLLSWPELWDVLRWYAHNRGYDGNARWSGDGEGEPGDAEDVADMEKLRNAQHLLHIHGTRSMAETFCAVLKVDPLGSKSASGERFKGLNAAFPRIVVEGEVRHLLKRHIGHLPGVDQPLIDVLMRDYAAIPCAAISVPARYEGGLLFGQLVPRFDNRIIAVCPFYSEELFRKLSDEGFADEKAEEDAKDKACRDAKVPLKESVEFYRFRWASQLANVRIIPPSEPSRYLNWEERRKVHAVMERTGALTPTAFRNAVRAATGNLPDNVRELLTHPDAKEGLVLDPVRQLISTEPLASAWAPLPEQVKLRSAGQWRKGKSLSLSGILEKCDASVADKVRQALKTWLDTKNTPKKKGEAAESIDSILAKPYRIKQLSGRAPYHRETLKRVRDYVFDPECKGHPREPGGPLYLDPTQPRALTLKVDEQTNNHLVRHRLLMLRRLHQEMLRDFAGGQPDRVGRVTIEVNRDLRAMSGMTAKEKKTGTGTAAGEFQIHHRQAGNRF